MSEGGACREVGSDQGRGDVRRGYEDDDLGLGGLGPVLEGLPDSVAVVSLEPETLGQLLYLNRAARRMLRVSEDACVRGRDVNEWFHPEALEPSAGEPDSDLTRTALPLLYRLQTADGRPMIVEVNSLEMVHAGHRVNVAVARDVTARVQAIREVRRLAVVVDATDDAVIGVDSQGNIDAWSLGAERLLGYGRQVMLGTSLGCLFADGTAPWPPDSIQSSRRHSFETVWRTSTGEPRPVLVSVAPLGMEGAPSGHSVIATDLRARLAAEERLRLLESVMVNSLDGIVISRPPLAGERSPVIVFVNRAFCHRLGYLEEELIGRPLFEVPGLNLGGDLLYRFASHANRRTPLRFETVNHHRDGRPYWVDVAVFGVTDAQGKVTHFIGVEREISEQKRTQALELAQRRVLEAIARGEREEQVFQRVLELLRGQDEEVRAAVVMDDGEVLRHRSVSLLSNTLTARLEQGGGAYQRWLREVTREEGPVVHRAPRELFSGVISAGGGTIPAALWAQAARSKVRGSHGVVLIWSEEEREPSPDEAGVLDLAARLVSIAAEQRELSSQLEHQAQHDALTQLPNRYLFERRLAEALAGCASGQGHVALLCIDLDRFKQINDTLGHAVGDELLVQVAGRLRGVTRGQDTLARTGGDEFVLVLSHLPDPAIAVQVAQRLVEVLKEPFNVQGYELVVTTSVGVGIGPQDGSDGVTLLKNADSALYHAKSSGRNTFKCFSPRMNAVTLQRLELERELWSALERGELRLHYQPVVELTSGEVVGLEALVRWEHHRLGMVPPGDFIPLAEEVGLIVPIGDWVLREVGRQMRDWLARGVPPVRLAVNVSALQFGFDGFVDGVAEVLRDVGPEAGDWLELEVTESVIAKDVNQVVGRLRRLREMGVSVSIDDFGTGYSSLAYLQRMPLDALKVDATFVREIDAAGEGDVSRGGALVSAIVGLAHSLGLTVTAEGVETEAQLDVLRQLGCDKIQGFLVHRPAPIAEIETRFFSAPRERLLA